MRIAILGAGAWGTALAINLSSRHEVTLWSKDPQHVAEMTAQRSNKQFLPDFCLPDSLQLTAVLKNALDDVELALIVVPVAGLRETLREIVKTGIKLPIVWGCKGFESQSALLPHQIVQAEFGSVAPSGVLSGPSFAQEVANGLPTALTLASYDDEFSRHLAQHLHSVYLRVYSSKDVIGVELGGALKNVISIAAGISDGLGFGYNARAALMTRGLMETTRLGVKLGGCLETFMGLSGVGDMILTATGDLSRNRRVGLMLAEGKSLSAILQQLGHVAEGVQAAQAANRLSRQLGVEMPIANSVYSILYESIPARRAVEILLSRESKTEYSIS